MSEEQLETVRTLENELKIVTHRCEELSRDYQKAERRLMEMQNRLKQYKNDKNEAEKYIDRQRKEMK